MKTLILLRRAGLLFTLFFCIQFAMAQSEMTDIDAPGFKAAFNNLKNSPRIVLILDPACGGCSASAGDFRSFILSQCDNPDLKIMVVYVKTPYYFATRANAVFQASMWTDPRAVLYWNTPTDDLPKAFAAAWSSCSYAWDFQLFYNAGDTWTTDIPPVPSYCMSKSACCSAFSKNNFLLAMNNSNICNSSANSIEKIVKVQNDITIYPNPASNSAIKISYNLDAPDGVLIITDLLGKIVKKNMLSNEAGEIIWNELPPGGFYVCSLYKNETIVSRKKIIINQ